MPIYIFTAGYVDCRAICSGVNAARGEKKNRKQHGREEAGRWQRKKTKPTKPKR